MVQTDDFDSEGDIICVSPDKCAYVWILDFGCSYHMTLQWKWFTTFKWGISKLKKNLISVSSLHENDYLKDMSARKLWLSHKSYIKKVLEKVDMSNSKVVNTSLTNHLKLSFD